MMSYKGACFIAQPAQEMYCLGGNVRAIFMSLWLPHGAELQEVNQHESVQANWAIEEQRCSPQSAGCKDENQHQRQCFAFPCMRAS